jgi:hypothetical protein
MNTRISRDGRAFARQLVRAGRNESPASGAEERALTALGLSTALSIGAVRPRGASSLLPLASVGGAVLVVGLATAVGVAAWTERSRPHLTGPPSIVVEPTVSASAARSSVVALSSAEPPAPQARPTPTTSKARVAKTVRADAALISGEVALVQQAARALATGEPGVALAVLDTYSSQYPRGALAKEAGVLRAQALARTGEPIQARALAERLLAADPNGLFAPRLRAVIDQAANPALGGP